MNKLILIIFIALFSSFRPLPDKETDNAVITAAEGQLHILLSKMSPGDEGNYGFAEADDLDDCTIGKPYRLLTFNSEFYSNDLEAGKDYIVIKNEWRAPVMIKSNYRNILTVSGAPGNYFISNMGDTTLAKELQQKSMSSGTGPDDAYYLLHITRLTADFFVRETNNSFAEAKFYPLESAIAAIPTLGTAKKTSYTLDEVEQLVKKALTEGTKQPAKKTKQPAIKKKK